VIQIDGVESCGFVGRYERLGLYSLDEVHAHVPAVPLADGKLSKRMFDGHMIAMDSARYRLFQKNCACVACGVIGYYYAMERSAKLIKRERRFVSTDGLWHFNLYGRRPDGAEVLMTKDHILPRAKGGLDHDANFQTMCSPCNHTKADRIVPDAIAMAEIVVRARSTTQAQRDRQRMQEPIRA
jgi:5-methylcytosine-specific restriction endonuclease McrA